MHQKDIAGAPSPFLTEVSCYRGSLGPCWSKPKFILSELEENQNFSAITLNVLWKGCEAMFTKCSLACKLIHLPVDLKHFENDT